MMLMAACHRNIQRMLTKKEIFKLVYEKSAVL